MNRKDLLIKISICFRDTVPPDNNNIILKDHDHILEAKEIEERFRGCTWEDISNQILLNNKAALGYFTNETFIYFLPSYMKLLITDFEKTDVLIDSLITGLTLPSEIDSQYQYLSYKMDEKKRVNLDEYFEKEIKNIDNRIHDFIKKTALLSYEQSSCVLNFLEYLNENYSGYFEVNLLEKAIKRYWFNFR
jgi:hypothetical protein